MSPTTQTTTAADGTFQLCAPAPPTQAALAPTVLVITALDATGKAYPPYATNRLASAILGTISTGSCSVQCMEQQQQSTTPVTISGILTMDPVAESSTVLPRHYIGALDGSGHIWSLAIPPLNPARP